MRAKSISQQQLYKPEKLQRLTNLFNERLTDSTGLFRLMVSEIGKVIDGAQFCFICLYSAQADSLDWTASFGISLEQFQLFQQINDETCLLKKVFVTGIPLILQADDNKDGVIVADSGQIATNNYKELNYLSSGDIPPRNVYALTIDSAQTGPLGVLGVGSREKSIILDRKQQNLLAGISEVVAIAINNARTIESLVKRESSLAQENELLKKRNQNLEKSRHHIQLQNLELLEVTQQKYQFLATTSHELLTPLNVILGLAQVLLRQRSYSLSKQQLEMVQRILNNGNHLLTVIDDMLCFAKVETGNLSFHLEELNLTNLIVTLVSEHRPLAERKNLNLNFQIELINPIVFNDKIRLKQLLVKLLLNAIKFTEAGSIRIKAWEINQEKIAIAIEDTGIGISETDLKYIFELFRQVDQTTTRKYGGTGLGLAISKSLVDIMQGKIYVRSEPGEGSSFCVELPRKIEH
ncbi:GAF domain-containing sensor histidine kinase [Mastigocoleus testarum]|uniref:Circadian input-output histidine kinase CikA n=1 Tax=Mastigocoleus testarum BC008 TaxID=371196 RepID=A0A0V7ZJ26_9CYAN|nr:HAMP domain-containing sensor histidine kinase [Mastigocoleus testarum]KST64343.1 hypothetical protein BC008_17075 [Mastigocoleus testarum BC008]KST64396.1 hypothetical protein BC008_17360 [Mastigocoleus testarum BC008]